ncbi:MAG TPA: CopG family transcriptional regulator [Mycobacteriales bacterium]|jgi:hypothetical protein|nr:CopG family transcriptional regulator [Mycobacteriales bacterium]
MRTTITLADDVALAVEEVRRRAGRGISEVVNDLLRRGLAQGPPRPEFRQQSSDMGSPRLSLDDVAGLLDSLEGDDRRS